jgi:hypothetical protein
METPLPGLKRPGLTSHGSNPRIGKSCAPPDFTGRLRTTTCGTSWGPASVNTPDHSYFSAITARAAAPVRSRFEGSALIQRPAEVFYPGAASNEAGIYLIKKVLTKYVGVAGVIARPVLLTPAL